MTCIVHTSDTKEHIDMMFITAPRCMSRRRRCVYNVANYVTYETRGCKKSGFSLHFCINGVALSDQQDCYTMKLILSFYFFYVTATSTYRNTYPVTKDVSLD